MSPLELIRNGILENDFEKVIQGYALLTGEEVRPEGKNESAGATNTEPTSSDEVSAQMPMRSEIEDFTMKRESLPAGQYGRKEPIQVGENQFVDDRSEAVGEEFDTPDVKLTPRRPPVKMVEVTCNTCGRKEEINPAYKTGSYHRCSRCVG
tara:strand:- start:4003 stop:4455 length:453 start_codon:yes stop_codon:yes gene_type:complete